MLRERLTTVLLMVEVVDVGILEVAPKQHVGNRGFVFVMVEVKDVRWKDAQGVLRAVLVFASLMEVEGVANFQLVRRVLKAALCSAKHMEGEGGAYLLAVRRVLRGVLHCAKDTVVVNDVCLMVEGSVRKVFMGAPTSVLLTEAERGVLFLGAQRVHVGALIAVSGMVVGSDAKLKTVEKVPKAVPTSAKPTGVGNDAAGVMESARNLLGVGVDYVQLILAWFSNEKIGEE